MAIWEAKTEASLGGYVQEATRTIAELRSMTVLNRDQLPKFDDVLRYASQVSDLKIGAHGDQRLQLTPLDQQVHAHTLRALNPNTAVLDVRTVTEGNMTLLAQGELAYPMKLDNLKTFWVDASTCNNETVRIGPISAQTIMRQFNEDCKRRREFFAKAPASTEHTLLTAPWQTNIMDSDGNHLIVRLVRHLGKVCLLGVVFTFEAEVKDIPPMVECALCLEECAPSEWSCVQCRNLLHHACWQKIVCAGISSCPYCRFE